MQTAPPRIWFTRTLPHEDVQLLRRKGIEPVVHPLIEIQMRPVQRILRESRPLPRPDGLLFTSKNAVDAFLSCLAVQPDWLTGVPVYAVGAATAGRLLQKTGRRAHTPPEHQQDGTGIARRIIAEHPPGTRIWHFAADRARPEAGTALQQAGLAYDAIITYATRLREGVKPPEEAFSGIAFYSPSAVDAFMINGIAVPDRCRVAAIGRTTKQALQQQGFRNIMMPAVPATAALAELLLSELEPSR